MVEDPVAAIYSQLEDGKLLFFSFHDVLHSVESNVMILPSEVLF